MRNQSIFTLCVEKYEWVWQENNLALLSSEQIKDIADCDSTYALTLNEQQSIAVPIFLNEKLVDIVACSFLKTDKNIEQALIYITAIYKNYIAIFNESEKDSLTNLYNRRTFEQRLNKLLKKQKQLSRQNKSEYPEKRTINQDAHSWIAMFDIDHFKLVNDQFGHIYGDEVLLIISQLMKRSFRTNDLLFRFGGDEFVIILESTSYQNASMILNRFKESVANYEFPQVGFLTVSIGFCKAIYDEFPITLIENADRALYYSKMNGRNKVNNFEALLHEGKLQIMQHGNDTELF